MILLYKHTGMYVTLNYYIGLDWIGLDWIGLDWIGLDWIGLDWIELRYVVLYCYILYRILSILLMHTHNLYNCSVLCLHVASIKIFIFTSSLSIPLIVSHVFICLKMQTNYNLRFSLILFISFYGFELSVFTVFFEFQFYGDARVVLTDKWH